MIRGVAASRGRCTGIARVVTTLSDAAALEHGEVLVCRDLSPASAVLLRRASAVVADTGGLLSNAASIAREFGVPAVVAAGDATQRIRNGQLVTVDGTRGIVTAA